jgi:hypothetical protein
MSPFEVTANVKGEADRIYALEKKSSVLLPDIEKQEKENVRIRILHQVLLRCYRFLGCE